MDRKARNHKSHCGRWMILRNSKHFRLIKLWRLALVAVCALVLTAPAAEAKKKRAELPVEESAPAAEKPESAKDGSEAPAESSGAPSEESLVQPDVDNAPPSLIPPLQGKTEVMELILEDQSLYKQAMIAIDKEDFGKAIIYLQELIPQLGEGYEPYRAECMYYEAGCHQMLNRMNAAMDTYKKAFELFEKYDSSNPLRLRAWTQLTSLNPKALQGKLDQNVLQGKVDQHNINLVPQKALIAIDPNAVLEVRDNNRNIPVLDVNDRQVLPVIVKECFSDMTCLETAEIGSNVTNADTRWMPLMASGRTAAFGLESGGGHPAFRVKVNGRSYLFDVILPEMAEGQRKILLVTNHEKICAVDVDSFDTWLLRMGRAKDGRITTARWYKLTHKKNIAPTISGAAGQKLNLPSNRRNW